MSDKQREDHVQAKYWNGFITRTEVQKVFDEYGQVINSLAQNLAKFDAAISCMAEKFGITPADVNAWIVKKSEEATKAANGQANANTDTQQEVSRILEA